MKQLLTVSILAAMLSACNTGSNKPAELKTFSDSASYAVGISVGLNLSSEFDSQDVDSSLDRRLIIAGLADAISKGEMQLDEEEASTLMTQFVMKLAEEKAEKNLEAGKAFLAENAKKPGVITTSTGLQYIVMKEGEGESPRISDVVVVHFVGKRLNGDVWNDTHDRGQPLTIEMARVLPGWQEGLQLMKPGAEYKLFIPSELAFGNGPGPQELGIGPNEVILMDVQLIDVIKD